MLWTWMRPSYMGGRLPFMITILIICYCCSVSESVCHIWRTVTINVNFNVCTKWQPVNSYKLQSLTQSRHCYTDDSPVWTESRIYLNINTSSLFDSGPSASSPFTDTSLVFPVSRCSTIMWQSVSPSINNFLNSIVQYSTIQYNMRKPVE